MVIHFLFMFTMPNPNIPVIIIIAYSIHYYSSECLCIPAHAAAQGKLLPRGWVLDVQGTLCSLQRLGTGPHWTLRQLRLHYAGQALEVVVTRVTEVGGTKAEVDSHRAAVAALVLQEVSAMLGANLNKQKEHMY